MVAYPLAHPGVGPLADVGASADPGAGPDPLTPVLLRARDGDPRAAEAFVRATQAQVWRLAAALSDPGAADDLTQETYLRAFRSLPGFAGRSSARTWLLAIARHACADHLRVAARHRSLHRRLAGEPAAHVPDAEHDILVADLLRRLPAERRVAFALTQIVGLPYHEAAEVEGIPVGTVRSRVARARSDLIAVLGDGVDADG